MPGRMLRVCRIERVGDALGILLDTRPPGAKSGGRTSVIRPESRPVLRLTCPSLEVPRLLGLTIADGRSPIGGAMPGQK